MIRLLICLGAAAMFGCAAPPAYVPADASPTVVLPSAKVGDYWEYAVRDGYTGIARGMYRYEVSRVDNERIVVNLTHEGNLVDTLIYGPGWNGREHPLPNLQRFRYEPSLTAYPFPLAPGKTWRTVLSSTDVTTGRKYNTHVHGKVVGWERVSVPAGEFDALKVQRQVFAGNMEGFRTQEEITEIDWYAPAVQRAVRTHTSSQHLDTSRGGGDGGGMYPLLIRGDFLIAELVGYSR
jgi:hypothetical protein